VKINHKKLVVILSVATILKVIIILGFYQNVIDYEGPKPKITSGYGWDQLVDAIYKGKYEMQIQSGLNGLYNFNSKSYRPPVYPLFLFVSTYLGHYSALVLVILQSIITSLVAIISYMIVKFSTKTDGRAFLCLAALFLLPMNFLKSGSIDEEPLFIIFLLGFVLIFGRFIRNQEKLAYLFFSGILLGLSTLTRYTSILVSFYFLPFLFFNRLIWEKRLKKIIIFYVSYLIILAPWLIRNYSLYCKLVLSSGSGRILFVTLSNDFINLFPAKSIDIIERDFLRKYYKSHQYFRNLDEVSTDREFHRLAINKIKRSPYLLYRSMLTKLKVFIPTGYYPTQNNMLKNIVFLLTYYMLVISFIISLFSFNRSIFENKMILIVLTAVFTPGVVYFMLSRHFYVPFVLIIIFSCINFPLRVVKDCLLHKGEAFSIK